MMTERPDSVTSAIDNLEKLGAYALCRLPGSKTFSLIAQKSSEAFLTTSAREIDGKAGFIIAPFNISESTPIIIIEPEIRKSYPVEALSRTARRASSLALRRDNREDYKKDFATFSKAIGSGEFEKLVLSRSVCCQSTEKLDLLYLFEKACKLYPNEAIMLCHTQKSGTWMMASPELLLNSSDGKWNTVALAGTKPLKSENDSEAVIWDSKNRQEQRVVADYIDNCLLKYADNIQKSSPFTVKAGSLAHICTSFCFDIRNSDKTGELIASLYPTPAVCGTPKETAKAFIIKNESSERKYYAGFMGTYFPTQETNLYVSLRCMQIEGNNVHFHAGGGLLKQSQEAEEWKETENKMQTMQRLFNED